MARRLIRLFLILFSLFHLAASCPGTETGNPGNTQDDGGSTETYTNDDFGVSGEYDSTWSATDQGVVSNATGGDSGGGNSDGGCEICATPATPAPATQGGIDISSAPSTIFTDEISTATIFYVTLSQAPSSLADYLAGVFPTRTFLSYLNGQGLAGFRYDNPEEGATGGDLQEYYFLKEVTLLYIVTDLFEVNDAFEKFETLVNSLRFE